MMNTQHHQQHLTQLCEQLTPWQSRFDDIADIHSLKAAFEEKLARFASDEQQLNIAIMGQVKAGKSSFLNALLFDGRQVLPTAATPKTANLTRISYGDSPALEVEYYTPEEWQDLQQLANQQGDTDHIKIARELVDMIKLPNTELQQLLTQGTQRIEANSLDDLMGKLNQYAGNDGAYTALVKMTRLYLPIEELKGFDVIDTPGMNDPVLSRTQKTKEEMARCDVVFFLSRSGQFLEQSDIRLLSSQLPQSGVKRIILVAGQYDGAILDAGYDSECVSLADIEEYIRSRLNKRANAEMGKLAEQRRQAGRDENAELLEQLTTPILSSTFAHGFAHWPQEQWNEAMQKIYKVFNEIAKDHWNGYEMSREDWQRISSFDQLTQAYQVARQDKQQLLQQQKEGILPEAKQALADVLNGLKERIELRVHTLKTQDIAELEQQQQLCERQIKRMSQRLEEVIEKHLADISQKQREISQQLKQSMRQYDELKTRTGTETHEESYTVSTSTWWKLWSWGSSETRYRTVSVNYQYLSASDAVEQISRYERDCQYDIETKFNKLISVQQLKLDLRRTLVNELDTKRADFDPAQFRITLEHAINRLALPTLKLSSGNVTERISRAFKGEIRSGDQIDQLKRQFNQALTTVFEQLEQSFSGAVRDVQQSLQHVQQGLQQDLTKSVQDELAGVQQDFANQQHVLNDYTHLLSILALRRS
jgi:hypothetical protein